VKLRRCLHETPCAKIGPGVAIKTGAQTDMDGLKMRAAATRKIAKENRLTPVTLIPAIAIMALTAVVERINGRIYICKCGFVKLWEGAVHSSGNSQHIADWYTLSHIIHGFLFYGLTYLVGKNWPIMFRLALATLIECGWEILENSSFIINRYREGTISLDYFGDSILNSMSDVGFMIFGFVIANRLPMRSVIVAAIAMDNLTLNVVMLLHPIDVIKNWQAAL
jgi:Protein of unknown function (DUF2585)